MKHSLSSVMEAFTHHSVLAGKAMRQMLEEDAHAFFEEAVPVLRRCPPTHAFQYLLTLLMMNDLLLEPLTDPGLFSFEEAVALAKQLARVEPLLDIKLLRTLRTGQEAQASQELANGFNSERGIRLLDMVSTISDGARILPIMSQLLQHPDSKVRSKAALIVGRNNKSDKWLEQRMEESDPRVRANSVESLWGVDSEGSRRAFWDAAADSNNRVVGNALLGLYRLGEASSVPLILNMLDRPEHPFRVTGIWVMGETGDQRFLSSLGRMMNESDPKIRAAVFRAVAKLKQSANSPAGSQIKVHLRHAYASTSGSLQTMVLSPGPGGAGLHPVLGLKPTQFVIYENSRLVTDYQVQEIHRPESVWVAFAVPRCVETTDAFHLSCEAAFSQALTHKRKNDAWLVLKYLYGRERENAAVSHINSRILKIEQAPGETASPNGDASLPSEIRYQSDPHAILGAVAATGSRLSTPPSPLQALASILPHATTCRGRRHVVLIYHPDSPQPDPEQWNELARHARVAKIVVHVIAFHPLPALLELTAGTNGTLSLIGSIAELPKALEVVCAGMIHAYSIRYHSVNNDPLSRSSLKVQVYSAVGWGEDILIHQDPLMAATDVA